MNITTIGIDLAKTSFSLAGSDKHGKIVLRKTVNRGKLLPFIAQCPACLIGLEACSGAHYWAREFEKLGHQVRIIAVKFIEPYRKGCKNDNNDAEAICEAVRRPNICAGIPGTVYLFINLVNWHSVAVSIFILVFYTPTQIAHGDLT